MDTGHYHPEHARPAPPPEPPAATRLHRRRRFGRLFTWGLLLLAAVAVGYGAWARPEWLARARDLVSAKREAPEPPAESPPTAWLDGERLVITPNALKSLGIETVAAEPQTKPMLVDLLGTTAYDGNNLSRVRPMFKGRVDAVHTEVGETVKKGQPLVELYSTELAKAKNDYEIERIQWEYDKNLLDVRQELFETKAVSEQLLRETKNNEMKSKREYEVARDNLLVYGLNEQEVEHVKDEEGSDKAKLTLRSPADGIVIDRDVVPGNLYDENDNLLVIAPLDHLWVFGYVFESDMDLVGLGQTWEIRFPFLSEVFTGKVEYISNRVDPGTHAIRIRASIPNTDGKLKSDMLVRGALEIPPRDGRTVVPRTSMIVAGGFNRVLVRVPGAEPTFEERKVQVALEKSDHVVLDAGVKPGEEVVKLGGLILHQLKEDLDTDRTGAPPSAQPGSS